VGARMLGRVARKDADESYELLRVHLVALASEIVVVAALIDQELARAFEVEAQEIRRECCQHRAAAEDVLYADRVPEELSLAALRSAVNVFHGRLAHVRHLRNCAEEMRPVKVSPKPRFPRRLDITVPV
jgi:hypothetical protein